jgi:hypothetical protein
MNWINTVNTTTLRIIASVCMAFLGTMIILSAIVFAGWEPKDSQLTVLFYLGMGVLAMMGIDLAQFATKRFTHSEYVAAKKGPSPVTVEAPSTVQVDASSADAPVTIDRTPVEKDD